MGIGFRDVLWLKIISLVFNTREIARFESERQALARMDRRHIAKVMDAGRDRHWPTLLTLAQYPIGRSSVVVAP